MANLLSVEQAEFLKTNVENLSNKELTNLINSKYSLSLKSTQIKAYKQNHKIKSGLTGRFKKGNAPANKGRKYPEMPINSGMFSKGNRPHNYLPVGTERVNGDGYVDIKVSDPNKWVGKHILVWEKINGKKPKGFAILFADQNKRNFDLGNLVLVNRRELLIANKKALLTNNTELTKSGLILAKLYAKLSDRKRPPVL